MYESTSDEQIEKLTREFNIHYRACIGSLIFLSYTRVEFSFAVQKLAKFSENPGKVQFELLIHFLRHIRYNKTLGLNYYSDPNDAPVNNLFKQAIIKTKNHLMDFFPPFGKIFQTLEEVQKHKLFSIKVGQLTMVHMFQDQLLNPFQIVSTMQHALQEWL